MVFRRFLDGLVLALFSAFLSCANVVTPSGGNKDVSAPEIKHIAPEHLSKNIKPNNIVISFDEYFSIANPASNVLISPAIEPFPVFSIRGKKLIIKIPPDLKDDKTYIFNLNSLVKDINEGIELKYFQYVFSTGSNIDSCSVKGSVVLSPTLKPANNIWVGLYNFLDKDSFTQHKPLYIARTDVNGLFEINYIKNDQYALYVLDDQNQNLFYDLPNEKIGFINKGINFDTSTNISLSPITLFDNYDYKELKVHSSNMNHVLLSGWFDVDSFYLKHSDDLISKIIDDSLIFFKSKSEKSIYSVDFKNGLIDTVFDIDFSGSDRYSMRVLNDYYKAHDSLIQFKVSSIIDSFYGGAFLQYDSISLCIDSLITISGGFNINLNYPLNNDKEYLITFKDSAFRDIYNNYSSNLLISVYNSSFSESGKLIFNYDKTLVKGTELILLYNNKNLLLSKPILKTSSYISFSELLPGNYDIYIINDKDLNRSWSTGIFSSKRLPEETVYSKTGIELRANWEIEDSISFKSAYK